MPSRTLVALVALAVVAPLAGCSMPAIGQDPGTTTTTAAPPDDHGFAFVAEPTDEPFAATVTVSKDGERLVHRRLSVDGAATYARLPEVAVPSPYTVTVNTTLPGYGSGNMSERVEVDGALGNETLVDVSQQSISVDSVARPRVGMAEPMYVYKGTDLPAESTVVVRHRGDVVYEGGVPEGGAAAFELTSLPETGAYTISVTGLAGERWRNDTVVVSDPGSKVLLDVSDRSPSILVYPPGRDLPDGRR